MTWHRTTAPDTGCSWRSSTISAVCDGIRADVTYRSGCAKSVSTPRWIVAVARAVTGALDGSLTVASNVYTCDCGSDPRSEGISSVAFPLASSAKLRVSTSTQQAPNWSR